MAVVAVGCLRATRPPSAPALRPITVGLAIALEGKGVETRADGMTRIAGRGPGAFQIVATTKVDRHPYPNETVIAILTTGERVVRQAELEFDATHARARFDIPAPGAYRVEIWVQDRFVIGNTFVAAAVGSLDGQRALELHQDAAPRLFLTRERAGGQELFGGGIRWMHWDALDMDAAYVAEWWHEGTRVGLAGEKRSELQRQRLLQVQIADELATLAGQPAWHWTTDTFELPDHLPARAGQWELRIYREEQPAIAFGFEVTADGAVRGTQRRTIRDGSVELEVTAAPPSKRAARQLAKLPRTRFEASKRFLLPVTVAEVRALTRSAELGRLRIRLNRLQRQQRADASNAYGFGDGQESPQLAEARSVVRAMQRLIAALGEPWSDVERP